MEKLNLYIVKSITGKYFKIGVTSKLKPRLDTINKDLGGINKDEIFKISSDDNWTIRLLEKELIHYFSSFKYDINSNGKTEIFSIECLNILTDYIKNKINLFDKKHIIIELITYDSLIVKKHTNSNLNKSTVYTFRIDESLEKMILSKLAIRKITFSDYIRNLVTVDVNSN